MEKTKQLSKFTSGTVLKADDAKKTLAHLITRRVVDRDGDVIEPKGGRFENYRKNPVVLGFHSSWQEPVGKNIGLEVTDNQIMAVTQFAGLDQLHEKAERLYRLYRDGFLNAWSIGFMPITWSDDKALPTQDGYWFKEWELLEYSAVPIPSNPEALGKMLKSCKLPEGAEEKDLLEAFQLDSFKSFFDVAQAYAKQETTPEPKVEPTPTPEPIKDEKQTDPVLIDLVAKVAELGVLVATLSSRMDACEASMADDDQQMGAKPGAVKHLTDEEVKQFILDTVKGITTK